MLRDSAPDKEVRMYARVATFQGGDRDELKRLNERRLEDGSMGVPDGVRSVLMLEDRVKDRHLFVTFFDSREAIVAAEARFERMGDEIPEELRGRRLSVDVYEVAFSLDAAGAQASA
jgi:hypothetical protein